MTEDSLYDFIRTMQGKANSLSVRFVEGDTYWLNDLDLCKSIDSDDEPIMVTFANSFESSVAYKFALSAGFMNPPGTIWTSSEPHEPVGITYYLTDVFEIYDTDKNYVVYRRKGT